MNRTNKLIAEIVKAGYNLEITPWMGDDYTIAIYNEKLKRGTHYHAMGVLNLSLEEQIEGCLTNALHFVNET